MKDLARQVGDPHYQQASRELRAGRWGPALALYDEILLAFPGHVPALHDKALALRNLGRREEALACLDCAVSAAASEDATLLHARGALLMEMGRNEAAVACLGRVVQLRPFDFSARWGLAMARIPTLADSSEAITMARAAFAQDVTGMRARTAQCDMAGEPIVGSSRPFCLAFQDYNNRELLSAYGALCAEYMTRWMQARGSEQAVRCVPLAKGGLIGVGIVSAHLYSHSVWHAITEGWLRYIDRNRFSLHLFHLAQKNDGCTHFAQSQATSFIDGPKDTLGWAQAIAGENLDVLLYPEVGMDAMTLRLAALRLAPVQAASWGHPETSGMPEIDHFLSSDAFEPSDAQEHYRERLVRLPGIGSSYVPLRVEPADVDEELHRWNISAEEPWFLCPGGTYKYAHEHDSVFVDIAAALGRCRFVFFVPGGWEGQAATLQARLASVFQAAGQDGTAHLAFIPWQSRARFFGLMRAATGVLDPIGFSGFNTAMQVVECGVPLVAWEGRFMRGRFGSGILRSIGMHELVAGSRRRYVELAVKLAQEPAFGAEMRSRMVAARESIMNDTAPVRGLERFLEEVTSRQGEVTRVDRMGSSPRSFGAEC